MLLKNTLLLLISSTIISTCCLTKVHAIESENPDLYALAESLGAYEDSFSFSNYKGQRVSDEVYNKIKMEHQVDVDGALSECNSNGMCYGFSTLEVLVHNGVISPSDLVDGSEKLSDISYCSRINDMLSYYSVLQSYTLQDLILHEYYCSHDTAEQCEDLIKYGEKAVNEGKYFVINFYAPDISHSITGIGIADGNWEYNGKKYDKCILTLDSNLTDSRDLTKSGTFDKSTCIYVNSELKEFYFPAYNGDSSDGKTAITFISDDTDFLNSYGYINPSEINNSEYDSIKKIEIGSYRSALEVTVNSEGTEETYNGESGKAIEGLTKNAYSNLSNLLYFRKADSFKLINTELPNNDGEYSSSCRISSIDGYESFHGIGCFEADIENNRISIKNIGDSIESDDIANFTMVIQKYRYPECSALYRCFRLAGQCEPNEEYAIELTEKGVLLTSNSNMSRCQYETNKQNYDEEGNYIVDFQQFYFTFSNEVMIRYDDDLDEIYFAIGENYDTIIEKGDVNCDGRIDASDASLILESYANLSTGKRSMLYEKLADYNGDGNIDASDASEVLAEYAERATS